MADYRPPSPKIQTQDLKGKVALITGATKGIGRAIALDLATRGASILGTYSSSQSAHNFDTFTHTVSDLYRDPDLPPHLRSEYCPALKGIAADITSLQSIDTIIQALERDFNSKLDIVVICASYNVHPNVGEASESDITNTLTGNLQYSITLVETLTRQSMFNHNSRLVVISSDRLRLPRQGMSLYAVSKAGLEALVRVWSLELPSKFPGTTVNAVSVGLTDTPLFRGYTREKQESIMSEWIPKVKVVEGGRMGYSEEVADVVGFLCSEKSRWVTGSVVAANGGAVFIGGSH